jgi:hypothetical protein
MGLRLLERIRQLARRIGGAERDEPVPQRLPDPQAAPPPGKHRRDESYGASSPGAVMTAGRVESGWTDAAVSTDAPSARSGTDRTGTPRTGSSPAHADPAHADPAHTGPAHGGPAPTGPAPTGPGPAGPAHAGPAHAGPAHAGPAHAGPAHGGSGRASASARSGSARARIREAPAGAPGAAEQGVPGPRARARAERSRGSAREPGPARSGWRSASAALRVKLPFAEPHPRGTPSAGDGRRHCGSLERVIWRQWEAAALPPPEVVRAIDRLAELPQRIKDKLADGIDAIFIGPGGVPELDEMTALRGVALPSGRASWDACAGAYGERKIVVGTQPSPTPDVMCHEIGHALDDLDSLPGQWQSDSAEFRMLYDQCQPHLASDFHRQPGGLGRKEFFADAFAAIASQQRPALVEMLGGQTRIALRVMLYFNRRYDI